MTGPPTPPPSSALEIQDAARSTAPSASQPQAPVAAPAPTPATPAQDVQYELAFPALSELAAAGRFADLISAAEDLDLAPADKARPDRLLIITPLVLSYLIVDNLPPAQHALTRLPSSLASQPIPQALIRLVASASERIYEKIFPRAEEVRRVVQDAEIPAGDLKTIANLLLEKYIDTFRWKTFALISKAFTSVPVPLVQQYLGCSAEQVLSTALSCKWGFDEARNVLLPVPTNATQNSTEFIDQISGQCTITTLKMINVMDSFE